MRDQHGPRSSRVSDDMMVCSSRGGPDTSTAGQSSLKSTDGRGAVALESVRARDPSGQRWRESRRVSDGEKPAVTRARAPAAYASGSLAHRRELVRSTSRRRHSQRLALPSSHGHQASRAHGGARLLGLFVAVGCVLLARLRPAEAASGPCSSIHAARSIDVVRRRLSIRVGGRDIGRGSASGRI